MKRGKYIFTCIFIIGFIVALGAAGTSDYEAATGIKAITETQLITRLAVAFGMMIIGGAGKFILTINNNI